MGGTSTERKIKMLTAKKNSLFSILQNLLDLSKSLTSEAAKNNFLTMVSSIDSTRNDLLKIVDNITELNFEVDENFQPDFQILRTIDEMCCHIQVSAARLRREQNNSKDDSSVNVDSHLSSSLMRNLPTLPKIELPEFSGNIREWETFYSIFKSLIHENELLTDNDKVNYLVGRLRGSALTICSSLAPTGENYEIIWNSLVEKYQDKRALATNYLCQILEFKPIQGESSKSLNIFLEKFDCAVQALKKLQLDDMSDFTLMHQALSKLDTETVRSFEMTVRGKGIPTYENVIKFVKEQSKILALNNQQATNSRGDSYKSRNSKSFFVHQNSNAVEIDRSNTCIFCSRKNHSLSRCNKFKQLSPSKRYATVRDSNWCYNCLSPNHGVRECPSEKLCSECSRKHHFLLHMGRIQGEPERYQYQTADSNTNTLVTPNNNFCATALRDRDTHTVLLSTVVVNVLNGSGGMKTARFLVDSGSQVNLLTNKCCRKLGLKFSQCSTSINGVGSISNTIKGFTNIIVSSRYDSTKKYSIEAFLVDKITDKFPMTKIDRGVLKNFGNMKLADEQFDEPAEVDGIMGADLFAIIVGNSIPSASGSPVAVQTVFGHMIMGKVPKLKSNAEFGVFFNVKEECRLNDLISKFWEMEQVPQNTLPDSEEETCENLYSTTFSRDCEGRFTVALPFKNSPNTLGNSKIAALTRLYSLERKLTKFPDFRLLL